MPIIAHKQGDLYTVVSPEAGILALKESYLIARQNILDRVEGIPPEEADKIMDTQATDGDFRAAWVEAQHREVVNLTDDVSQATGELEAKADDNQVQIDKLSAMLAEAMLDAANHKRILEEERLTKALIKERDRLIEILVATEGGKPEDFLRIVHEHMKNSPEAKRIRELRTA